jgi:hypothetical protein
LGIGIFVSMLREQHKRGKPLVARTPGMAFLVTLRRMAGVWLFFSILRIWDHDSSVLWRDTAFFFSLFRIQL